MKKILISILFFNFVLLSHAKDNVRKPFDDVSYAWTKKQIEVLVDTINKTNLSFKRANRKIVAAIFPHDDHLYSGITVNSLISQIGNKKLVIIFGVTHKTPTKMAGKVKNILIFDNYKYWYAPYQNIKVSDLREYLKKNLDEKDYIVSDTFHKYEHSIEAVLPFLSYYNREGIEIMPIMIPPMDLSNMDKLSDNLSKAILNYLKEKNLSFKDVVFLISADANHYGEDFHNTRFGSGEEGHRKARDNDFKIFHTYFEGKITEKRIKNIVKDKVFEKALWCGRYDIPFGLLTTEKIVEKKTGKHLFGNFVRYDDTYIDPIIPLKGYGFGVSAPFSLRHWVGHMAIAFTLK